MKPGDYVEVKGGVWDSAMPDDRPDGIVLEVFGPDYKNPDQVTVLFCNGAMLKFHKSQLRILKTIEQYYL
tara:strand:+ start:250 stop:459 length:210 start_codon:yes stop_codon:yes gene_type:complete